MFAVLAAILLDRNDLAVGSVFQEVGAVLAGRLKFADRDAELEVVVERLRNKRVGIGGEVKRFPSVEVGRFIEGNGVSNGSDFALERAVRVVIHFSPLGFLSKRNDVAPFYSGAARTSKLRLNKFRLFGVLASEPVRRVGDGKFKRFFARDLNVDVVGVFAPADFHFYRVAVQHLQHLSTHTFRRFSGRRNSILKVNKTRKSRMSNGLSRLKSVIKKQSPIESS